MKGEVKNILKQLKTKQKLYTTNTRETVVLEQKDEATERKTGKELQ